MKTPQYPGTRSLSVNMTPMIDVTFLLIIFFLVSSHLAKQENFLPLPLPVAAAGLNDTSEQPTLTIQVLGAGDYRIGTQSLPLDQVRRVIQERNNEQSRPVRIRIRTDKTAPYDSIGALLKICTVTGNSDVVFAVYSEQRP
jgi:biopolymer transport protein ExbD